MSEAQTRPRFTGMFDYTQKNYWGGPWYMYWSLIVITIFGGFIGLDHLYLRSPTTAFLKSIVNIFGLGIWYVYDLVQICGEKDSVMNNGLSAPVLGPLGIGAGMFTDNQPGVPTSKSPFRYLGYHFLTYVPFGFDYLIAGDTNGALAKFLTTFLFFLWGLGIIWSILNVLRAIFAPKSIFEKGMYRLFPFSWFMDTYGPSKLGPIDLPQTTDTCEPGGKKGMFRIILSTILEAITALFGTILNIVLPGVRPATIAVTSAVQAGATAAGTAATAAGTAASAAGTVAKEVGSLGVDVLKAVHNPVVQTVAVGSNLSRKIPSALQQTGSVASSVGSSLNSMVTPQGLQQLAATAPVAAATAASIPALVPYPRQMGGSMQGAMQGGGIQFDDRGTIFAIFLLFTILLSGGTYYTIYRLNNNQPIFQKSIQEDDRRKRNDAPPKPSSI